jgi:hypothetical protein
MKIYETIQSQPATIIEIRPAGANNSVVQRRIWLEIF